jgi:meiotic recombination protein SPO11
MTKEDIKTGELMLQEPFVKNNPLWVEEVRHQGPLFAPPPPHQLTPARAQLTTMMETKQKAEIQALSSFGFQYISTDYLPRKLREGDWV